MFGDGFDLIYARHVKLRILALGPYFPGGRLGYDAQLGHAVCGMGLNFKARFL